MAKRPSTYSGLWLRRWTSRRARETCREAVASIRPPLYSGGREQASDASPAAAAYIGGVKPSLPTARRPAFRLPSASFVAVTRSLAPTLASALVPGWKVTIGVRFHRGCRCRRPYGERQGLAAGADATLATARWSSGSGFRSRIVPAATHILGNTSTSSAFSVRRPFRRRRQRCCSP